MAENTKIEWADHTFNPWVGCTKVSPACDHCYAESWAKRTGQSALWAGDRRRTSAANWQQPLKWNRQAQRDGTRPRVFCASLADVFDNQVQPEWRQALWRMIVRTPHLDWLLLTKRPQNIAKMLPWVGAGFDLPAWGNGWPNVWLGTTVENQAEADRRIPHLLAVPTAVHFLSCEPLLGPVEFRDWWLRAPVECESCDGDGLGGRSLQWCPRGACPHDEGIGRLRWIITGGESGPNARPSHPDWFRSLRDQCAAAGVPFHFKQWGEWLSFNNNDDENWYARHPVSLPLRWWDGAAWREAAGEPPATGDWVARIGKKAAGRMLDGVEHNGAPGHD